jgi:hypothetical protein
MAQSIRRFLLPAVVTSCIFFAGCVSPETAVGPPSEPLLTTDAGPLGNDMPEGGLGAAGPIVDLRVWSVGPGLGEPTLGVARDGTLFVSGVRAPWMAATPLEQSLAVAGSGNLVRSRDAGRTWKPVIDPIHRGHADMDPMMWLDPITDRVFNAAWAGACSELAWSDDLGESWQSNPTGGCGLPGHDHQKLTSGPKTSTVQGASYSTVLFYAYNPVLRPAVRWDSSGPDRSTGTSVSTSLDGGLTWALPVVARSASSCGSGGLSGPVAVGPDGTAMVAMPGCGGVDVATSRDSGRTWSLSSVTAAGRTPAASFDPIIAVAADATAYLAWPGKDGATYVAATQGASKTWSAPLRVSPESVTNSIFSTLVAGPSGEIAVAYLGTQTPMDGKDPSTASPQTVWHLYLTVVQDYGGPAPRFSTLQVTPSEDPAQRGCVWMKGGDSPCRNLLDFMGMGLRDGKVYIAYTDGCDGCKTANESVRSDVFVAVAELPSWRAV